MKDPNPFEVVTTRGSGLQDCIPCPTRHSAITASKNAFEHDPLLTSIFIRQYYTKFGRHSYRVLHTLTLRRGL
jgi:hypothetical protein